MGAAEGKSVCDLSNVGGAVREMTGSVPGLLEGSLVIVRVGTMGTVGMIDMVGYRVKVGTVGMADGIAEGELVGITVGKREGGVGEEVVMVKGAKCRSI